MAHGQKQRWSKKTCSKTYIFREINFAKPMKSKKPVSCYKIMPEIVLEKHWYRNTKIFKSKDRAVPAEVSKIWKRHER